MDEKRDLDGVLRAIAEPRRRAILSLIATSELPAGEIAQHFSVTRSAVSQHLQVLKDAGLITERREGTRRLYRASEITLGELRAFFENLWSGSLDRARSLAEGSNGGGNGSAPH